MENVLFEFLTPISEKAFTNNEFSIKGIAISETTTLNNHKFLGEELELSAPSLKDKPLLKDHKNEVDAIVGRVTESAFDGVAKNINFSAAVKDKRMIEMIKDGRIKSVSVGASVKSIEEDEDGSLVPRGIMFNELSLVAVPADPNASFSNRLQQAYSGMEEKCKGKKKPMTESHSIELKGGYNDMAEQEVTEKLEKAQESLESKELKIKELSDKVAEFEAKERKSLEESYAKLCEAKGIEAESVAEMSDTEIVIAMKHIAKIKEQEEAEAPAEEEKADKPEDTDEAEDDAPEVAEEKLNVSFAEVTEGIIGGHALTVVRSY